MVTGDAAAAATAAEWETGLLLVGVVHMVCCGRVWRHSFIIALRSGKHVRGPYYVIMSRDIADGPQAVAGRTSSAQVAGPIQHFLARPQKYADS